MIWNTLIELDTLFSLILIIIYGLLSLRYKANQFTGVSMGLPVLSLKDTYLFIRLLPLFWVLSHNFSSTHVNKSLVEQIADTGLLNIGKGMGMIEGIELLLAVCVVMIMPSLTTTNSFEASLLVLLGFIFQYYMLHSTDLLTFFLTLEAQNFSFFVLCGMLPFAYSNKHNISMSIEVGLKYLLLSAFSSGILLYGTSLLYIQTGSTSLNVLVELAELAPRASPTDTLSSGDLGIGMNNVAVLFILCSILFKLGVAPYHLWMYQLYGGTHRTLILYITTIPKLCIIGFWMLHLEGILSNYTLVLFSILSGFIGSTAFTQPNIRNLLVYSSISEMGLLVAALETAGYNALLQHLSIYIVSQYLLWNINSTGPQTKRIFPLLAISLAGMPPLAGFFGKAWIFWHLTTVNAVTLLVLALLFAFVSIVFYLRLIRLSWNTTPKGNTTLPTSDLYVPRNVGVSMGFSSGSGGQDNGISRVIIYTPQGGVAPRRVYLTSTCVVLLVILPIFLMKPFF